MFPFSTFYSATTTWNNVYNLYCKWVSTLKMAQTFQSSFSKKKQIFGRLHGRFCAPPENFWVKWHCRREELVLPLGSHTSVFQAEVYALLTCSRPDSPLLKNNCSITICSDILAAIKAVSAHKATTGLGTGCGHCGTAGNEKVDILAKQAFASYLIGPEPSVGISVSTICTLQLYYQLLGYSRTE